MRILPAAAVAAGLLLTLPAVAAPAPPQHFFGTIAAYDGAKHTLEVKTTDGKDVTVTLTPDAKVIANQKATLADIKPGDFVASAALKKPDGKLHAQEVRIFPDSMRGLGEGQYGMDRPDRSMTNATVTEVNGATAAAKAGVLKLTFHGSEKSSSGVCSGHATGPGKGTCTGETEIVVGPEVPVTRWILGDTSWLEKGKVASIFAMAGPDGKLVTRGVVVEHNGIKPRF